MRVIWWLLLPSLYLIFCIAVMRFLKWANEDDTTLVGESTPEDLQ